MEIKNLVKQQTLIKETDNYQLILSIANKFWTTPIR